MSDKDVLPEGWLCQFFTDVLDIQGGTQPPKSTFRSEKMDGYVRLLQIRDFGKKPVPTYILDTSKLKKCIDSDVLIGRYGASLGRICTGMFGAYNVALAKVIKSSFLDSHFIKYYLISDKFQFPLKLLSRSAQNGFNKDDLASFIFLLPPLPEQKVIADTLNTLLAKVDTIKTTLDSIPAILKRFRQSVLSAAVSGKLIEEYRQGRSYDERNYPLCWKKWKLSEVGELARGKSKHRPRKDPKLFGDKYPFIQTGEVANSNEVIHSAIKFYNELGLKQSRLFPKGTLCITIAANIADTAILSIDACFPDSIVGFTPKSDKCLVKFIKYIIDVNKENIEAFAPATAQKNINLKILNELNFSFPPLEEQTAIVQRVEQLFAYADKVETQVKAAQAKVNLLTQSILAKAFRGELTAKWRKEHPELISGENSAKALLEKIAAEREHLAPKKRSKRPIKKSVKVVEPA